MCLLRGTYSVFKSDGCIFVLKGLIVSACVGVYLVHLIVCFTRYMTFLAVRKILISRGYISKKKKWFLLVWLDKSAFCQ